MRRRFGIVQIFLQTNETTLYRKLVDVFVDAGSLRALSHYNVYTFSILFIVVRIVLKTTVTYNISLILLYPEN